MTDYAVREGSPRVAVIIPCFDDGATLMEAVASAREPEQEPCEVVIVDDGSTDAATLGLLDRLREEGIDVIRQPNAGLTAARMAGLRAVTAPYVFPLDADDALEPGALKALADALDADLEAAAAWSDWTTFGDVQVPYRSGKCIDAWLVTYLNLLPVEACFRRSVLLEVGGWKGPELGYEDWSLWMSLAERGYHGVHLPLRAVRYRVHGSRMWSGSVRRHDEIFAELRAAHTELFASRARNRRRSSAPVYLKILLPIIAGSGFLPARARVALSDLLARPVSTTRKALGVRRHRIAQLLRRRWGSSPLAP